MKKGTTICITAALAATLAAGALAGCGGQAGSSASASASTSASAAASASASAAASASATAASASASASAAASASTAASASASASAASASASAAAQSSEELIAELKAAIANTPAFKSVTVEVEEESASTGEGASESASASTSEASAEPDELASTTVYKFDESGDKVKTSSTVELNGVQLQYFTDGDQAVFVTDGPSYSGTTEQFDLVQSKGFAAYLKDSIGDLNALADCVATIEKMESNGLTIYMTSLDPEKYMATNELLGIMAEYGDPVKEALLTIAFEEDGSLAALDLVVTYEQGSSNADHLMFSNYDNTVVDPLPEADRTYDEMEADMQLKLDAFEKQLETAEGSEAAQAE